MALATNKECEMSDYLTIEEIADDLQIPRRTIYYYMQKGDFPRTKNFGRHKRVHIDDYLAWQASRDIDSSKQVQLEEKK
jgi:excisionase family DNA binding protein